MLKLLKDPLSHFIIVSIIIFMAYQWLQPSEENNSKLLINEARISQLESRFEKIWHRAPTSNELDNLKRQYVLDQIYAIEARAIGIDRSDAVVIKRLRQKMEFMLYGIDTVPEPTAEELQQYFSEHRAQYPSNTHYQYLNYSLSKSASATDKERFISAINSLNQFYGQPEETALKESLDLRNKWGQRFVNSLQTAPLNQWLGPIESNEAIHFVKVEQRIETDITLEAVKPQVILAWKGDKAKELQLKHQQQLLNQYGVVL